MTPSQGWSGPQFVLTPGGTNVKLERISLTQGPLATNIWLRAVR